MLQKLRVTEKYGLWLVGLAAFSITIVSSQYLSGFQNKSLNLIRPPAEIEYFTLGYRDVVADSLWIRVIQNFDYCENSDPNAKSVNKGINIDEVLSNRLSPSRCHLSWVYRMVDAISTLAPRFRMAQATGATILSIAVDDREGARRIFDKAVKNFPEDWSLAYRAAYHYLYEIQDAARAADLLTRAAKHGGPPFLVSLAARLYDKSGQYEIAKNVLLDYIARDPEGPGAERAKQRLAELEKQWAESQKKSDDRQPAKVPASKKKH